MGLVPVREYTSAQELIEAARRRKLYHQRMVQKERPRPPVAEIDPELTYRQQELIRREAERRQAEELARKRQAQIDSQIREALRSTETKPERVMRTVCAKYHISKTDLLSMSRQTTLTVARGEVAYIFVNILGISLSHTGRFLNKDHTTVIHAHKRYGGLMFAKDAGPAERPYGHKSIPWDKIMTFEEVNQWREVLGKGAEA
jgi:hypothetical protein